MLERCLRILDQAIARLLATLAWLVVPVALLLFLQWPLRDLIQGYSREANDLGQWIYALYMAGAVTAATRAGTHVSADALARSYPPLTRQRLARLAIIFGFLPWALFVIYAGLAPVIIAVRQLEHFADTNNPFYFVIKLAALGLAILMAGEAVLTLARCRRN